MNCKKRLSTLTIFTCLIAGVFTLKALGQDPATNKDAPTEQASGAAADLQDDEVEQFESFDDFK